MGFPRFKKDAVVLKTATADDDVNAVFSADRIEDTTYYSGEPEVTLTAEEAHTLEKFIAEILDREAAARKELRDLVIAAENRVVREQARKLFIAEEHSAHQRLQSKLRAERAESDRRIAKRIQLENIQRKNRISERMAAEERTARERQAQILRAERLEA